MYSIDHVACSLYAVYVLQQFYILVLVTFKLNKWKGAELVLRVCSSDLRAQIFRSWGSDTQLWLCSCWCRAGSALEVDSPAPENQENPKIFAQPWKVFPKLAKGSSEPSFKKPEERLRMAQQQHPQQPSTPPAPAAGQANGPNMSQVIMQMTAQMTQG